jgi:hypothetical protein
MSSWALCPHSPRAWQATGLPHQTTLNLGVRNRNHCKNVYINKSARAPCVSPSLHTSDKREPKRHFYKLPANAGCFSQDWLHTDAALPVSQNPPRSASTKCSTDPPSMLYSFAVLSSFICLPASGGHSEPSTDHTSTIYSAIQQPPTRRFDFYLPRKPVHNNLGVLVTTCMTVQHGSERQQDEAPCLQR